MSKLLESLTAISYLRKSVLEIIALIESQDDFPKAIQMCKDGKKLLSTFQHFKCIDNLSSKLNESIDRIWHDMNTKLRLLILNNDFSDYRFDEFIRILNVGSLLVSVGDELFSSSSSLEIERCINSLAQDFFNAYHKFSMDELRMFLENELWEIVPVKNDFRLVHLKEFSFLRESQLEQQQGPTQPYQISECSPAEESLFASPVQNDTRVISRKTNMNSNNPSNNCTKESVISLPNDLQQLNKDKTQERPATNLATQIEPLPLDRISLSTVSDGEDLNSELEKDFVDEDEFISSDEDEPNKTILATNRPMTSVKRTDEPGSSIECDKRYSLVKTNGPVLTNTSLNVLRLFGRYIQMMTLLEPISYDILMKVYNLLDYYTMEVFARFGPDKGKKSDDKNISPKLRSVVRSIRESLIKESNDDSASSIRQQAVPDLETIAGQNVKEQERKAVAIESLIYLVNQLWNLQQYLESLIPAQLRPRLKEQFTQADSTVPDFLKARAELDSIVK